jgi:hypothetical protein
MMCGRPGRLRWQRGILITVVTLCGCVASEAGASAAVAVRAGWWTAANEGAVTSGVPDATAPVGADVPPGGLLVQGGQTASSPTAFGAVGADLVDALPRRLTLAVAPNTATTPGAVLKVCALADAEFDPAAGAPMSDAPAYACTHSVDAAPNPDGTSYSFPLAGLGLTGSFAVAVLPTSHRVLRAPRAHPQRRRR